MNAAKPYTDFSDFLAQHFTFKVQKISINAGFTCPNRDGTKGLGGCTYCNNQTFNPDYCKPNKSISAQLAEGKSFFGKKYPNLKYLAYFQTYTNTYADISRLSMLYEEALSTNDVTGLIIGTRPDCMPQQLLNYLSKLSQHHFVMIEYGVETSHNSTLKIINRGHSWEDSVNTVKRTHDAGITCGTHIILGLPSETESMMLDTIDRIALLPISTIKLHQLQLIKGTRLAREISENKYHIEQWTADQYIALCSRIVQRLPRRIAIERFVSQSPDQLLISPRWGLKNYEFTNRLLNYLRTNNITQPDF